MTRPTLKRFIAALGITDAAIKLGRGPHQLERWRDGVDAIPQAVTDWLAEWSAVLGSAVVTDVPTLASIRVPAGSLGVNDPLPTIPGWRLRYSPAQIACIEAMASSKGVELDEQTAAELWDLTIRSGS